MYVVLLLLPVGGSTKHTFPLDCHLRDVPINSDENHEASYCTTSCIATTMEYKILKKLIKEQYKLNKAMEKQQKKKEKLEKKLAEMEERNKTIERLLAMSGIGSGVPETCSICLEQLDHSKREVAILSPCEHKFCHACICKWLKRQVTCPICRCSVLNIFHQTSFF